MSQPKHELETERRLTWLEAIVPEIRDALNEIKDGGTKSCAEHKGRTSSCELQIKWLWGAFFVAVTAIGLLKAFAVF